MKIYWSEFFEVIKTLLIKCGRKLNGCKNVNQVGICQKAESVSQKAAPSSYQGTEKRPSNQAWNVQSAFWKQLWHVCTGFFPRCNW